MGVGNNWDRTNSTFQELKNNDSIYEFRGKRKLTWKERRERVMSEYHARESYRSYGTHRIPFISVIFRTAVVSFFGFILLSLYVCALIISIIALTLYGGHMISFLSLAVIFTVAFVFFTRPYRKRLNFVRNLKKVCKENKYKLYMNKRFWGNIFSPSGACDFSVETDDRVYLVMFFPAPKRLSTIRFTEPNIAQVVTRILKNRFTTILNINPKVNFVSYSFEAGEIKSKKSSKVLLLNPAPYSMQAFDKMEGKVVESGNGAEFFGYTAYTGTGFINRLKRENGN